MVVLRVAHPDRVVRRQSERLERGCQPRGLVDAGRQHHDRALVEDHLQLESEIANRLEHRCLVGLPRRHDHATHRQGLDRTLSQGFDEALRRSRAEGLLLAGGGHVEQRTVLGHDVVEQIEPRADPLQVIEIAAGDQQQLAAGLDQALERREGFVRHLPVVSQRAVIVTTQGEITHS